MTKLEAINFYGGDGEGGRTALAAALGVHPSAISQWGDYPPALRQYQLQQITRGKLKAEPDAGRSTTAA